MHDIATTHDEGKGQYFWVWGVLLILTAVEVVLAYKQVFQPVRMLEALMMLSIIKSALIIGYFMHLKYEIAAMKWVLMIAVVACLCLMGIFFADAFRILHLGVG
jgi:caa(3)-type oxidase subunit IV